MHDRRAVRLIGEPFYPEPADFLKGRMQRVAYLKDGKEKTVPLGEIYEPSEPGAVRSNVPPRTRQ